jgi:hypothetical protein
MPDWNKDPLHWIQWHAGLARECLKDAGRFDECNAVWGVAGILIGTVCAVGLAWVAAHFLRERAAYRRAWRQRMADAEVASAEEMEKHRWKAVEAEASGLSKEEIARRIRDAKTLKRFENAPAADTAKGDKALGIDILHR